MERMIPSSIFLSLIFLSEFPPGCPRPGGDFSWQPWFSEIPVDPRERFSVLSAPKSVQSN